jgi:hypothetical protein
LLLGGVPSILAGLVVARPLRLDAPKVAPA